MIFTVLDYKNLDPLMVIDDYISAVWNNKYFTAGDFEIICRTTNERILKVVRNNFINLNGTDEIAVIETVEFNKDEEQGATMKITGKFAQSLLSKRIVWNKTLLNGTVESELQRLINENALNPTDKDRKLDSDSKRQVLTGRVLNVPEEAIEVNDLEIISDTNYLSTGTAVTYVARGASGAVEETGLRQGVSIVTTEPKIIETKKDGTTRTLEYNNTAASLGSKKIYSVNTDVVANTSIKNGQLTTVVQHSNIYNFLISVYGKLTSQNWEEMNNKLKGNLSWSWYEAPNEGGWPSANSWIKFEIRAKVNAPDHIPMSSSIACLSKEEYLAGKCGVTCFDNYIWIRAVWANSTAISGVILSAKNSNYQFAIIYDDAVIGETNDYRHEGLFLNNGSDEELIFKTNVLTKETYNTFDLSTGNITNISTNNVAKYELKQVNAILQHYLNAVATLQSLNLFNYLALGKKEGLSDEIVLQLVGDNLQTKIEEVLQLYNLGMRARYVKDEKKIYFDFYKGYNRTKGTIQPIIYSESLDNLESYNVVSANAPANVALVYSEKDGEIISGKAGVEAGALRRETYINKSDNIGYLGADYVKQLQEEGKLSLQAFSLAISADIDNRSYIYRRQFYVGDIATIVIKDLNNISYNVRILEVREYNDISGYTIELVLGE